jgi:small subunit ribosomal protein S15
MPKKKAKPGNTVTKQKIQHPDWSALNPKEVESRIVELAKSGKSTSEIGMILRDQYAVPDVRVSTGKKISEIIKENELTPELPEDLRNLMNSAMQLRKHTDGHAKDFHNKRSLYLIESRIRRLTKYYQNQKRLSKDWKYSPDKAKLMVE